MKLGFIGVGNMGGPMCRNLVKGDHQVMICDLNKDVKAPILAMGATEGPTARQVTAETEVVFTSLPGPKEITEVVLGKDGIAEGAHKETIYVDLSTNSPTVARKLAADLKKKGIPMLDAPVSGGTVGAEAGTVAVMVGGEKKIFDQVKPLFEIIGANVYHVGDHGAGCTVKVINNMLSFINMYAANEGFMLGVKAGVDPRMLLDVVRNSSGNSNSLNKIENSVLPGNFEATFALDLAHKDLRLALELGQELGSPLMLGSMVVNQFRQSVASGHGSLDTSAMIKIMEENMGLEVRHGAHKKK